MGAQLNATKHSDGIETTTSSEELDVDAVSDVNLQLCFASVFKMCQLLPTTSDATGGRRWKIGVGKGQKDLDLLSGLLIFDFNEIISFKKRQVSN